MILIYNIIYSCVFFMFIYLLKKYILNFYFNFYQALMYIFVIKVNQYRFINNDI